MPVSPDSEATIWLGLFVIPPRLHPLAEHGARLIGYDIWSGTVFPDDETRWPNFTTADVQRIRSLPGPFGAHIVVSDPLQYPTDALPTIVERLQIITRQFPPFILRGASYDQQFWDTTLALRWEEGINDLHRLAVVTTVHINTLRHRLPRITVPMTTFPDMLRDWAIETVFGQYRTLDKYYPHLILANTLQDRVERDKLWRSWQRSGCIARSLGIYDLHVDRVFLVTRPDDADRWIIHPDHPNGFLLKG